jgi:hypothetical protein
MEECRPLVGGGCGGGERRAVQPPTGCRLLGGPAAAQRGPDARQAPVRVLGLRQDARRQGAWPRRSLTVPVYAIQHLDLPAISPPDRTGNIGGPCGIDTALICLFGRPIEPNHDAYRVRPSCSQVRVLNSVGTLPSASSTELM